MDFKGDKIRSTLSFEGKVKPSQIYGMLKNPASTIGARRQNSVTMFLTCFVTKCLLALLTDVPGGRIRWLEQGCSWG
jgi:hypothetical protein